MRKEFLLPAPYKKIGIALALPGMIMGALVLFEVYDFPIFEIPRKENDPLFSDKNVNMIEEISLTLSIVGLLMIAFAREKEEDEYIRELRLESLQWAVLINYALLLVANWVFYGFDFMYVMIYNMLTILLIFIIRFHYVLRKSNSPTSN